MVAYLCNDMVKELKCLTETQEKEVISLMGELAPEVNVSADMLRCTLESHNSHFFVVVDENDHIMGCATLCVFESPTGKKASIEDVVVSSMCRGRGLGRLLMEHIIAFSKDELQQVDLHLTSNPRRVAANELYKKVGFQHRETNAYVMKVSSI